MNDKLYLALSPKILFASSMIFVFLLFGQIAFQIIFVLLFLWSLINVKHAIQSLTLIAIIPLLNPGLYSIPENIVMLRWLVLVSALSRIYFEIIKHKSKIIFPKKLLFPIFLFSTVVGIFSIITSYSPIVSLFKLLVFTFGVTGIIISFKMTEKDYFYWFRWFVSIFSVVVFFSAAIYFFPEIGYFKRNHGAVYSSFQGFLNHPQVLGTFLSPILGFITIVSLVTGKGHKISKISVILLLLGWFVLILTNARIGMISILLSSVIFYMYIYWFKNLWWKKFKKKILRPATVLIFGISILLVMLFSSNVSSIFEDYVLKNSSNYLTTGNVGVVDAMVFSRGLLIKESWKNFQNNKIAGIGFGIATRSDDMEVVYDPILGLPIGASVEKGFIFSAILEETGLIGLFLFIIIISVFAKHIFSRQDIFVVVLFLVGILINLGEMLFFSLGGLGLYIWLLIGLSTIKPSLRFSKGTFNKI